MTKSDILKAYVRIREIDQTIPDEVLDFMKRSSLEAIDQSLINEVSDEEIWKEAVNYTKNISKNAFNDSTTFKAGAEWMKSKLSNTTELSAKRETNPNYNPDGFHHETGMNED